MKLLHIDSSILGDYSVSRQLTAEIVAQWVQKHPGTTVEHLDLAVNAPSHFGADAIAIKGVAQPEPTEAQRAENALSEKLLTQFLAADVIVIGAGLAAIDGRLLRMLRRWLHRNKSILSVAL